MGSHSLLQGLFPIPGIDQVSCTARQILYHLSHYPPANEGDIRNAGLIPGSGMSPGGGHGNPFQYSCPENPIDRGAWRARVHSVAKSQTCDPMDHSPPGFSVHDIFQARVLEWVAISFPGDLFQARVLEWVAISFSRGSSPPRDQTWVSCIAGRRFTL